MDSGWLSKKCTSRLTSHGFTRNDWGGWPTKPNPNGSTTWQKTSAQWQTETSALHISMVWHVGGLMVCFSSHAPVFCRDLRDFQILAIYVICIPVFWMDSHFLVYSFWEIAQKYVRFVWNVQSISARMSAMHCLIHLDRGLPMRTNWYRKCHGEHRWPRLTTTDETCSAPQVEPSS